MQSDKPRTYIPLGNFIFIGALLCAIGVVVPENGWKGSIIAIPLIIWSLSIIYASYKLNKEIKRVSKYQTNENSKQE